MFFISYNYPRTPEIGVHRKLVPEFGQTSIIKKLKLKSNTKNSWQKRNAHARYEGEKKIMSCRGSV